MPASSLGTKLQELRSSRNLTQKQISEALNIVRATYAYYELDKRTPDLQTLMFLCKFYQIDISDLINEDTISVRKNSGNTTQASMSMGLAAAGGTSTIMPSMLNLALNIFSHKEKNFIAMFRQLTPDNQDEVLHTIKYKIKKQKNNR